MGGQHVITRDVAGALSRSFDLVVVGGGIYGASLLYEATQRGLSVCLVEANDFGGGTSCNSLRIVHGGLRYLQGFDLKRFFQHVESRRRMAFRFPQLVRTLPCVMPLYGQGLMRPSTMWAALTANDVLSVARNRGLREGVTIPAADVLGRERTLREFPFVRGEGLKGAARWADYFMVSSERILMEQIRSACANGAVALNYVRAEGFTEDAGRVTGVRVKDSLTGASGVVRANTVICCTGPWVAALKSGPVFYPSLAFNLLLDFALPTTSAMAVAAPQRGSQMLFLVPQKRTTLAGTLHLPRPPGTTLAQPAPDEIEFYLSQLRAAIPGCNPRVTRVFAGLLPAAQANSADLAKREIMFDHGAQGGLQGLYSVAGVKFTTASEVAEDALKMSGLDKRSAPADIELATSPATALLTDATRFVAEDTKSAREALLQTIRDESIHSVDDLIQRRSNWMTGDEDLDVIRRKVTQLVGAQFENTRMNEMRSAR